MTLELLIPVLLWLLAGYTLIGIVFAATFVFRGAGAIDPVARKAPLRVRVLFGPGAAALWPILLFRWRRSGAGS